jgi:hypothetical protein
MRVKIDGEWFKDEQGRTLLLRGVNLGGSSKVPFHPNGATHLREEFFEHRRVSFVGRPFPLAEADEHFRRLRGWGLTFLRLLVTWEAVEHEGPGIYDREYLDYLYDIVRRAGEHGLLLFIDPHQDVWSRFSGGDGAPGWTLEAAGLDMASFAPTGAAIVHATHGDPFPRMIWPTNETKLASATMFSLFFGGDDFAPRTRVEGQPVQEYLQSHYLAAIQQVARRLRGLPHVVGYDSLNEPSPGYIGWPDLGQHAGLLRHGDVPTPFQSMLLGAGLAPGGRCVEHRAEGRAPRWAAADRSPGRPRLAGGPRLPVAGERSVGSGRPGAAAAAPAAALCPSPGAPGAVPRLPATLPATLRLRHPRRGPRRHPLPGSPA